ncbi:adiponectin receptor protein 1b [Tachysurus ichikawai]
MAATAPARVSEDERNTEDVELTELGPLLMSPKASIKPRGAAAYPSEEEEEDDNDQVVTLPLQAHHAMEKMEEFVHKVWEGRWRVIPFHLLPDWLKDNDYLLHGLILFICLGTLTMLRPNVSFMAPLQEKVVSGMFFLGAVLCLCFSWLFHTVYCHSEKVSRTFSK